MLMDSFLVRLLALTLVEVGNRFKFFNPLGANQNTPPDDPEILQRGPEKLNQKSTGSN